MRSSVRFLTRHWTHLLLFIPGAILVTAVHEAAHGLAVILQGGDIKQFVILPSSGNWGFVECSFPEGVVYSSFLISLAPYILWLAMCGAVTAGCLFKLKLPFWWAGLFFLWWFVIPLADIGNAAIPWAFFDKDNDFFHAFGAARAGAAPLLILAVMAAGGWGFWVQQRLYRTEALAIVPYASLFFLALGGIAAITGIF